MSQKLFNYDAKLRKNKNIKLLCGIDETGRGCWAGPLVAAAVIFKPDDFIDGINDSKKLSASQRLLLEKEIKSNCLSYAIAEIDVDTIDKKGITYANTHAMVNAAMKAAHNINLNTEEIELFVIDQSPCKKLTPFVMMAKADSISASVAAASILAKTHRDRIIDKISDKYPEYSFNDHKGYINKLHVDLVNKFGLIDGIHRKSYSVTGFNRPVQINMMDFINET
jgi:ribonuclease HII